MNTALRVVLVALAIVFFFGFVLNAWRFFGGSLESFPTPEQQEKARIGSVIGMIGSFVPCLVCTVLGMRPRRK